VEGHYSEELSLLEQAHVALGSASRLDDFYLILASLLVDPNTFGFSRAYVLRYDERNRVFHGRVALGARTREEQEVFRSELLEEARILREQMEAIQRESPEPAALQSLLDLRYHSLWIQLLQGRDEGTTLLAEFQEAQFKRDALEQNHILERAAREPRAILIEPGDPGLAGLENFCTPPLLVGRLITRRGLHGILIADRKFETLPVDDQAAYHFQWLINHASVSLENVVLVSELTQTTERLREVDRLKSNFLSIVSHELRTPLTSIVGFVHLLSSGKAGPLTESQADLLNRVSQHAVHLQSMVHDLLEIAEVEAGGMIDVEIEPVDPLKCLYAVIPKIEARHGAHKTRIEPVITGVVPRVMTDEEALERIFFHLIDNAVKFSSRSNSPVTVEFIPEGEVLHMAIVDRGIGISPEHVKQIFDYFYQVDFKLDRSYGGMGIGLTVARLLLDATGGRIAVESVPGAGSKFTLTYPMADTHPAI
jgi:signal transduction histidine kinase